MFVYQRVSLSISLSHTQMWQKTIVHHIHFAHHFTIPKGNHASGHVWSKMVEQRESFG